MAGPTQAEHANDPSIEAHQALLEWFISHGGHMDESVRIAQDASRGVHLQVKSDWPHPVVPKETRVINTPVGVTMSYFNAIRHESHKSAAGESSSSTSFLNHGVNFPQQFIDAVGPEETTAFFLMAQFLRGPQGFWYPYLRTLPQPGQLTTPLFFGEEDVDWIQGTGIPEASVQRYEMWDRKFEESIARLEGLGFEGVGDFTWDLYLWASTILTSRAFSAKVLSGAIADSDLPEDGVSVLLPLIDLPNHRPLAKVEWRAGDEAVGLLVLEDIAPGQEISNNYGPRNNEQLLMNYGFCIANNPCDYRIVKLGVKPDSPLAVAKTRQRQMFPELANNSDDQYYIFNVFYPLLVRDASMEHTIFSPALFNALTVMEANQRERGMLEITESGICIPRGYGNGHSTLAALGQISLELMAHIATLRASAAVLPAQPANLNQTHAQIYRNGQISLDKAALVIASWTITRAREHKRGESWEDIKSLMNEHMARVPPGTLSEAILSRIRVRILERESLVTKNGELFRLIELVGLLPTEMQGPSQICVGHLFEQAAQAIPTLLSMPNILFGTWLCFLLATYRSPQARTQLSPRLIRWLEFLCEKYPPSFGSSNVELPDDDNHLPSLNEFIRTSDAHTWAPDKGVTWFMEDSGWLDANWLRWACSVVESEMVLIPPEPLAVLTPDAPVQILKQACLYVPQE